MLAELRWMGVKYVLRQLSEQEAALSVMALNPPDTLIYASANLAYHLCSVKIAIAAQLFGLPNHR